ncbi:MAG: hypothetical protein EAX87_04235 [Candidatus Thorarchaeota archaeon]|nr:hypothetical protein [Candidatus Thorarchaeota archaeon]
MKGFLRSNTVLVAIVSVAAAVWIVVFCQAVSDYILMQTWTGTGQFNLFGFTVHVQFEGWADYTYYYRTWGNQFLSGYTPYTNLFDYPTPDHYSPYFFPPLYVYLCALGNLLPFGPFGIAVLLCLFGFATAFPIYGIANYLSQNKHVGEIATATYLLNPLILFHVTYDWLNPAPFVFFMMLSFYLIMKQRRLSGTLAMVTAALFKQTAFFLALPLIAYLIRVPPSKEIPNLEDAETKDADEMVPADQLDVRGFLKLSMIVIVFVVALSIPYILDFGNYAFHIFLKPGSVFLKDVTTLPPSNSPITFAVFLMVLGAPKVLIQLVNIATSYSLLLLIGVVFLFIPMLLEAKDDRNLPSYWRRMLFLTLLLMLTVHIFSPRGIYKYYLVALIPFFSILSCERMVSRGVGEISASLSMIINPLLITLIILMPSRLVYVGLLLMVLAAYVAHEPFGLIYSLIEEPLSHLRMRIKSGRFSKGPL